MILNQTNEIVHMGTIAYEHGLGFSCISNVNIFSNQLKIILNKIKQCMFSIRKYFTLNTE